MCVCVYVCVRVCVSVFVLDIRVVCVVSLLCVWCVLCVCVCVCYGMINICLNIMDKNRVRVHSIVNKIHG